MDDEDGGQPEGDSPAPADAAGTPEEPSGAQGKEVKAGGPSTATGAVTPFSKAIQDAVAVKANQVAIVASAPMAKAVQDAMATRSEQLRVLASAPMAMAVQDAMAARWEQLRVLASAPMAKAVEEAMAARSEQLRVAASAPFTKAVEEAMAARSEQLRVLASAAVTSAAREAAARQYDALYADIVTHVPDDLAPQIEELGEALTGPFAEDQRGGGADIRHSSADEFDEVLEAFIAVGVAGWDLAVNTTTLAWLLTVRAVRQVWGLKAARRALATFIAVAWMVLHAAWLVNDGKVPSEAFAIGMGAPLSTLLFVWSRTDDE